MNAHLYTNILFKTHVTNNKEALFYDEKNSTDNSFFREYLLWALLDVQEIDVLEKPTRFLTLDLKINLLETFLGEL